MNCLKKKKDRILTVNKQLEGIKHDLIGFLKGQKSL